MLIQTDETKRAGRMIQAGRVTVTFRSPSGSHITLLAKCRGKVDGRWQGVPLVEAQVIFIEVPSDGGWNDKVGKVNSRGFEADRNADEARVFCAKQLLAFLAGQPTATGLEIFEEERCGRCGRQLTDPVSIERGIGPECYGKTTGSAHETKVRLTGKPRQEGGTGVKAELVPAETLENAARAAHEQAEADGTHEYARREIDADQRAFEEDLDRQVRQAQSASHGDGRDSKGVPYGAGDWRGRQRYLQTCRADDAPATPTPVASTSDQMTTLPGETFEDIFAGRADEMGVDLPNRTI